MLIPREPPSVLQNPKTNLQRKINSIPTLLSFSRQEAQLTTKITSLDKMKDADFLRQWIKTEARRRGEGRGGGKGFLGGLFGMGER